MLASDDGLGCIRNPFEGFLLVPEGVEQEAAALLDALQYVIFLKI